MLSQTGWNISETRVNHPEQSLATMFEEKNLDEVKTIELAI